MERERRLGTFVLVHAELAQAVAAAARREVVERSAESVAPEKPLERALRTRAMFGIAGDGERGELRLDEGRRVERLLVACPGRGLVAPSAVIAGQPQESIGKSAFVTEPGE